MAGLGPDSEETPLVQAIKVATGVGKTRLAAKMISDQVHAGAQHPFVYAVPTHRLGEEIVAQFRSHGVTAQIFRGRSASDPERQDQTMCDDLDAVIIALELGAPVQTSCCKGRRPGGSQTKCTFFETCSYQRQIRMKPQVWIVAHQLLFHAQSGLGSISGLFIDEFFWQAGIWIARRGLTLDQIAAPLPLGRARLDELIADVEYFRGRLAKALREQAAVGGVQREHVARHLADEDCTKAIALEWRLKEEAPLYPGMTADERRRAVLAAKGMKHVRSFARTWAAARELLRQEPGSISGRMILEDIDGEHGLVRAVRTRGLRSIAKQWNAPTFIMDATLPDKLILERFFPTVKILAEVDALTPHTNIRQVLAAPVSARKLIGQNRGDTGRNLSSVRRAILHRYLQFGRQLTLVIAQKAVAQRLKDKPMPPDIAIEHFNNVAGLDGYKDVRLLITIGRTLPSVFDVEALSGALTGLEPVKTAPPIRGPRWYDRTARGIRLQDETVVGVSCPVHPDPVAEACRWQICESEVLQAIGRGRGVNRTSENPLAVEIWADLALPLVVDEVLDWSAVPAGPEVEMMLDGVVLDSPSDMARCWPEVWGTPGAARLWRQDQFTRAGNPIEEYLYRDSCPCDFRYQRPGARQKWRTGAFDPAVVPDPQLWLEARLGPVAGFESSRASFGQPLIR